MSFFDKLKFWNREQKESRTAVMMAGGSTAVWSEKNFETFAKESYLKNVVSYTCINMVARAVASVPWALYRMRGKDREKIIDHPTLRIFSRANADDSFNYMLMKVVAFLIMDGNSYVERVPAGGEIKEFWCLRPDRIHIEKDGRGRISEYVYTYNGQDVRYKIDPVTMQSDILHLKAFHPTDDWFGAGVTESAAYEIDTSNEMTAWNKGLLQNQARPGMLFLVHGNLTDDQFNRMKERLYAEYSGGTNAGKNLIVEGEKGTDVKPYGWSPAEIDYIEGNREQSRRIAMAYGVPSMLLGIPGDNTYSNYQEARLAFWEETVFWYLNYLRSEFNNWLFSSDDGLTLDYVLDDVPALATKRNELWTRANMSNFITTNEKREMVGLDKVDGGDSILVPAAMIPLGEEADNDEETVLPGEEETEEEPAEETEEESGEENSREGRQSDTIVELKR